MKKIFLLTLIVVFFIGCGKTEKGVVTIENKSSYPVEFDFTQNYSSKPITLAPNTSINCEWERYFHCIIQKPSFNIITKHETKGKITIADKKNLVSYRVINNLPQSIKINDNKFMTIVIRLLDNGQELLSQNNKYANYIDITKPYTDIACFQPITKDNIFITCLDENQNEAKFNFKYEHESEAKTYKVIEKSKEFYFQEISPDNKSLLISQIEIKILDVKSEYVDTSGNKHVSIIPTIFINKN